MQPGNCGIKETAHRPGCPSRVPTDPSEVRVREYVESLVQASDCEAERGRPRFAKEFTKV